ncbi:MAG: translocation/assembly module TamB domain-containing protein, partial [bacterium]|nr:translocation/assembly module TamB domain-containing protein [bacterium]
NFPIDSLHGSCEFKNNQLVISELLVGGGANPIDTSQTPFHIPGIGGGFDYRATARGEIQNLAAELQINLHNPAYHQYKFDCGAILLNLQDNVIQVETFRLAQDSVLLELIGNFSLTNLNGVSAINFYFNPMLESDSLIGAVLLKQFDFEKGNFDHNGNISIEYDFFEKDYYVLEAIGSKLSLRHLSTLSPQPLALNGLLKFATHFSGNLEAPLVTLEFSVLKPGFENFQSDSLSGSIKLDSSSIEFAHLDVYSGASHAKAQARLNFPDPLRRFEFNRSTETSGKIVASLEDFQLLNTMLPDETQIDGAAWLNLQWTGSVDSPALSGMVTIQNGSAKLDPAAPLFSQLEAELSFQDSILSINKFDMRVQQFPVRLSGNIMAYQRGHFGLEIQGQIAETGWIRSQGTIFSDSLHIESQIRGVELPLFQSALPDLEKLQGSLNAEIIMQGNPKAPDLNGHLDVHRLSFQLPAFNSQLTEGRVKILFDHGGVKFDSVYSKMNEGSIFLTGKLDYNTAGIQHIDLAGKLENIKINRPNEFSLNVKTANINYRTQENHFLLTGEVILGETRVVYNFRPQMLLNLARSTERPAAELPLLLKNTRLNIQLRESENIWLDNNLARLRLHSELNVIGSFETLNLGGRLSVAEGYVLYLDRKFNITRGIIDFVDPNRINPIIDLEAKVQLKGYQTLAGQAYEITLAITGKLDQSVVTLTSVPELEKADIISLLTLGATRQQLTSTGFGGEEYSTTDILLERAKAFSSQRISSYAEKQLGNIFGLEQLSIEGNLFKFDKSWGPQLLASKKLSDRMEVYYTTTVGHMNEHNVRLEYSLTKKFSLEGQTDQQGRSGIGLKYKLKFK